MTAGFCNIEIISHDKGSFISTGEKPNWSGFNRDMKEVSVDSG
jgi:hypothetical protein